MQGKIGAHVSAADLTVFIYTACKIPSHAHSGMGMSASAA
jgi:hypothetical protein